MFKQQLGIYEIYFLPLSFWWHNAKSLASVGFENVIKEDPTHSHMHTYGKKNSVTLWLAGV